MNRAALVSFLLWVTPTFLTAQAPPHTEKKLIEFGWDEPDTAFMRQHFAEMEKSSFDGCVFHVNYLQADGKQGPFTWECWGKRAFIEAELRGAVEDLKATPFSRFKHNFLRFNVTPGDLDWFDDFSAILQNARLAGRVAKEGHCRGILFDIEQYEKPVFNYHEQRDAKSKRWEEYAAQAHRRGAEVMAAFEENFPDAVVFLTFGFSLPWSETDNGKKPLLECKYGLLSPFLDGMVEACHGPARLIDGHENAYGIRDPAKFVAAYETMKRGVLPIVTDDDKYARVFSFSFGIWLDADWHKTPWNADDVSKNIHPPDKFRDLVREALKVADEYVWIYSETPRWWSPEGKPVKLPESYDAALRQAKDGAGH